jgi:hypothetical protein
MLFSSVISVLGLASAAFASLDSHVARRNHTELVARQAGVVRGAVASYYKINTGNQLVLRALTLASPHFNPPPGLLAVVSTSPVTTYVLVICCERL